MAPAFDLRSTAGYAPIITGVTSDLLTRWDVLPDSSEIDVGAAMMHTTLHIISRTMFSANSDEIVDVVERGVEQYQMTVRPDLLHLLGFPVWFTKFLSRRHRASTVFNEFDRAVDQLITNRARQPNDKLRDFLARLVAARDAETNGSMTAKEVRDEVVTIFMAGQIHRTGFDLDLVSAVAPSLGGSQTT